MDLPKENHSLSPGSDSLGIIRNQHKLLYTRKLERLEFIFCMIRFREFAPCAYHANVSCRGNSWPLCWSVRFHSSSPPCETRSGSYFSCHIAFYHHVTQTSTIAFSVAFKMFCSWPSSLFHAPGYLPIVQPPGIPVFKFSVFQPVERALVSVI